MGEATKARANNRNLQRHSTALDIIAVYRQLLASGETPTLKAVASHIGITAPGLYRYVDSAERMHDLVREHCYAELLEQLQAAVAALPDQQAGMQYLAMTCTIRRWALQHAAEFQMMFTTPAGKSYDKHPDDFPAYAAYAAFYRDTLMNVYREYNFKFPSASQLGHENIAALIGQRVAYMGPDSKDDFAAGISFVFWHCWHRVFGVLLLEALGHVHPRLVQTGLMFIESIVENARDLGFADAIPELRQVVRSLLHSGTTTLPSQRHAATSDTSD